LAALFAAAFFAGTAQAELLEIRQAIYGMD
jgi:hypothetical protein